MKITDCDTVLKRRAIIQAWKATFSSTRTTKAEQDAWHNAFMCLHNSVVFMAYAEPWANAFMDCHHGIRFTEPCADCEMELEAATEEARRIFRPRLSECPSEDMLHYWASRSGLFQ